MQLKTRITASFDDLYCLSVYEELYIPGSSGEPDFSSSGYEVKGEGPIPDKVVESKLIYFKDISKIVKDYKAFFKIMRKEIFKSCIEFIVLDMYDAADSIIRAYSYSDIDIFLNLEEFESEILNQERLNTIISLINENDCIGKYIYKLDKLNLYECSYFNTRKLIEIYINDKYKLINGYRFFVNTNILEFSNRKYNVLISEYDIFDSLYIDVITPIGVYNYGDYETIYRLNINLDNPHVNKQGFKIDFEYIDLEINKNINEIIRTCKKFDKDGRFNDKLLDRLLDYNNLNKLKCIHNYICNFKLENRCSLLNYNLMYKNVEKVNSNHYKNNNSLDVFVEFEIINDEFRWKKSYSIGCISNKVGSIWDLYREKKLKDILEKEVLPMYNKVRKFKGYEFNSKLQKETYTTMCSYCYTKPEKIHMENKVREEIINEIKEDYISAISKINININQENEHINELNLKERNLKNLLEKIKNKRIRKIYKFIGSKENKYERNIKLLTSDLSEIKMKIVEAYSTIHKYKIERVKVEKLLKNISNAKNLNK